MPVTEPVTVDFGTLGRSTHEYFRITAPVGAGTQNNRGDLIGLTSSPSCSDIRSSEKTDSGNESGVRLCINSKRSRQPFN